MDSILEKSKNPCQIKCDIVLSITIYFEQLRAPENIATMTHAASGSRAANGEVHKMEGHVVFFVIRSSGLSFLIMLLVKRM